uniref:Uncharacterized protein n=1 Tax=Magallana gigas TaxID=29159 RepID=K1QP93_MAGGI
MAPDPTSISLEMGEFTELFQLMIIAIGLFPSINKGIQFNGNNAGGRKRKVEPQNKTALAMNSWSSSQKVTVTTITYTKHRMSHERHCSRKHGSTRENKPTTTKSLIIKKENGPVPTLEATSLWQMMVKTQELWIFGTDSNINSPPATEST